MLNIIACINNKEVFNDNLNRSQVVKKYGLQEMRGFKNIPEAYNLATVPGAINVYVHQDVYIHDDFEHKLHAFITGNTKDWGVVGVAGVRLENGKKVARGHINDRGRPWGEPDDRFYPADIQTLDELLLVTMGDFKFDENFPFDFYGADICMQSLSRGRRNYAINALVDHNSSRPVGGRTDAFYVAEKHFRQKWFSFLPIVTTCSLLK